MIEAGSITEVETLPSENSYALSTANILDGATIKAAFTWDIQQHIDTATKAGLDGIQIWPQGPRPLRQIRSGRVSAAERQGILSAHQSARDPHPHTLQEVEKAIFLPETVASTEDLGLLFKLVGNIPVVLFKENSTEYMDHFDRSDSPSYTARGIQTDPETATFWGAKTKEEYYHAAINHNFTSIIIDTHHIRRSDKHTKEPNPLAEWRETIPFFLPHTQEIHVSVGRSNFGDLDPEVIQKEADDMLQGGHNNTELIQMLRLIADQGWKGRVVLEMRPSIYLEAKGRKRFLTDDDVVDIYKRVRNTLYTVLDK